MSISLADLAKNALLSELEQLRDHVRDLILALPEAKLWQKPVEPGNSIGHLILHLTGNLNHFVGATLGKTGYVRDREREFTEAQPPDRSTLLAGLDDAVATFRRVVSGLTESELTAAYPEQRFPTVYEGLVHLVAHFALHRGQMTYLVRLVHPHND